MIDDKFKYMIHGILLVEVINSLVAGCAKRAHASAAVTFSSLKCIAIVTRCTSFTSASFSIVLTVLQSCSVLTYVLTIDIYISKADNRYVMNHEQCVSKPPHHQVSTVLLKYDLHHWSISSHLYTCDLISLFIHLFIYLNQATDKWQVINDS